MYRLMMIYEWMVCMSENGLWVGQCYNGIEETQMSTALKRQDQEHTIRDVTEQYKSVIENNFQKRENQLIRQLYDKAKDLKVELAYYKKEASQENIDKMIGERRREKEKERQFLQGRWRECTQSFKHMQEQQKRLTNQQKESVFDIKNLQKKIEAFDVQILKLKSLISCTDEEDTSNFVTDVKENYKSPYKTCSTLQQKQLERIEKEHRLLAQTQQHFFSIKHNRCQEKVAKQINHKGIPSQPSQCRLLRIGALHANTKSQGQSSRLNDLDKCQSSRGELNSLWTFLARRQVRLKLFGLLKEQL